MLIIVFLFFFSSICSLWFQFGFDERLFLSTGMEVFQTMVLLLVYMNSSANPIALCFLSRTYRQYFMKYLCCRSIEPYQPGIKKGAVPLNPSSTKNSEADGSMRTSSAETKTCTVWCRTPRDNLRIHSCRIRHGGQSRAVDADVIDSAYHLQDAHILANHELALPTYCQIWLHGGYVFWYSIIQRYAIIRYNIDKCQNLGITEEFTNLFFKNAFNKQTKNTLLFPHIVPTPQKMCRLVCHWTQTKRFLSFVS